MPSVARSSHRAAFVTAPRLWGQTRDNTRPRVQIDEKRPGTRKNADPGRFLPCKLNP